MDTDIGSDIDDTWALAALLKSRELDLKLVTTTTGDPRYRAKIVAKMLEIAGRTDVPIGIGVPSHVRGQPQGKWVKGYDLEKYSGEIKEDGAQAIVDAIMNAPEMMTLITIGPLTTIAAALAIEPEITTHARVVGMLGSIYRGYGGSDRPVPEYNVKADITAANAVFAAPWDMTITPLDTCGIVVLRGEKYQTIRACTDPLVNAVVENYDIWANSQGRKKRAEAKVQSSTLYDTVAIYLAFSEELVEIETLPTSIGKKGETKVDDEGRPVRCATRWKNFAGFEDFLVSRLIE
ncbi:MAG TPA: nucleoside hydrolase [Candidatus Lokiarchaeia archaeon]|nr:nucleoside hydrolase [Candidatus Lokiarchaeia archaeon]